MIRRLAARMLPLVLGCNMAVFLYAAERGTSPADERPVLGENGDPSCPVIHPVRPGPDDGRIAFITARMLEQYQYLRERFDASVSSKFFDRYFDALDPPHLHFLQSDIEDFELYRTNLNRLTIPPAPRAVGDTTPAYEIFNRFIKRLSQRVAYADELLKHEKFTFDADERIMVKRHDLPYPKDLEEAQKL